MQRSLLPARAAGHARASRWAASTSRLRGSTSAATSTTSSSSRRPLAVVLGDVTGHGIDATADMAMAKFVFRSLAREHRTRRLPRARERGGRRGDRARQVHHHGVPDGRPRPGACCARAPGHPPPRLSRRTEVGALACGGLALGIDVAAGVRAGGGRAAARRGVVLYTDGVIEARRRRRALRRRASRRGARAERWRGRRRRSPTRCSRPAARSPAATSPTTAQSSCRASA